MPFRSLSNGLSAMNAQQRVAAGALLLEVTVAGDVTGVDALGAARVPLDELIPALHSLPPRREIVILGQAGTDGAVAARILSHAGYSCFWVRGGVAAWAAAGEPVIPAHPGSGAVDTQPVSDHNQNISGNDC
jgi:rhodanese-related sulfurtransferase